MLQTEIVHRSRVNVVDSETKEVVGEAYRAGDREDWFVGAMVIIDPTGRKAQTLIGRVHTNHVSEVRSRKMILAMLNAYFGLDHQGEENE